MAHIPYYATGMKTTSERASSSRNTTKLAMKKAEEGRPHLGLQLARLIVAEYEKNENNPDVPEHT